ncbi:DUF5801 repeats-in-toxin domain-containing protein, partial [Tropicimonas sp. IMCC6043]|uniref:DUF5801 repeats-in-toxin domain-containing protein n=1 Tax=Tropicimonas sp. IMCC6043 TaxID=2510645 RepID=UPI00101D2820
MAISFTLNNAVNNDQSSGLQVGGDVGQTPDTDVTVASLNGGTTEAFYDRLVALSLLPDAFESADDPYSAEDVGAASQFNSVTVDPDGEINALGFSGVGGAALPVYDPSDPSFDPATFDETTGGATGLTTTDGEAVYLFRDVDSGLGNQMVYGVDSSGDVVFVVFMYQNLQPDGTIEVDFHMVSFEGLYNDDGGTAGTDPDHELDLGDFLTLSASETIVFDFEGIPAGKNTFFQIDGGAVSLLVTASTDVGNDGAEIVLNTSEGNTSTGSPTTIGYDNNWIEVGETVVYTFITAPQSPYVVPTLDQNQADDEINILNGGVVSIDGGSVFVGTVGGKGAKKASLTLSAYDTNLENDGALFFESFADDTLVNITSVRVLNASGTELFSGSVDGTFGTDGVVTFNSVDIGGGVFVQTVSIENVRESYVVEYTADPHERLWITGDAGQWRLAGGSVDKDDSDYASVGSNVVFDDAAPSFGEQSAAPSLTVDESDFTTDDSADFSTVFDPQFGTDGFKDADDNDVEDDDAVTYALNVVGGPDVDSGLVDTLTNESVVLNLVGGVVIGSSAT